MVFPIAFVVFVAALAVVYWYAGTRRKPIRAAFYAGGFLGILRATLASAGWYVVEHSGGPLQVPAYALAMLSWPEAMIFTERRTTPAPPGFYLQLSVLLVTSTVVMVSLVGAVATLRRKGSHRSR